MDETYVVALNNIVAGVVVTDGIITETAPVFQKFSGANLSKFTAWVKSKGGHIELVNGYYQGEP
jgi:hypothetical protein